MSSERGAVFAEEAYALGKMLDHSCWQVGEQACWQKSERRLPRFITPSDLDTVFCRLLTVPQSVPALFDNNGRIIFAELSRGNEDWRLLSNGQFKLYRGLLEDNAHCAVLCRHSVRSEDRKKICTRHDVVSFQPMVWDHGPVIGNVCISNAYWQNFVFKWFEDPIRVRRQIIGFDAGMRQPVVTP